MFAKYSLTTPTHTLYMYDVFALQQRASSIASMGDKIVPRIIQHVPCILPIIFQKCA